MKIGVISIVGLCILAITEASDACEFDANLEGTRPRDGATAVPLNAVVFAQYSLLPMQWNLADYPARGPDGQLLPVEAFARMIMLRPARGAASASTQVDVSIDGVGQRKTIAWSYGDRTDDTPPTTPSVGFIGLDIREVCFGEEPEEWTIMDVVADSDTVALVVVNGSKTVAAQLTSLGTTISFPDEYGNRCYNVRALDIAGNASALSAEACVSPGCTCALAPRDGGVFGLLLGLLLLLRRRGQLQSNSSSGPGA